MLNFIKVCIFQGFHHNFTNFFCETPSVAPAVGSVKIQKQTLCGAKIDLKKKCSTLYLFFAFFLQFYPKVNTSISGLFLTNLVASYFVEDLKLATSDVRSHKDVCIKCIVYTKTTLVKDQQSYSFLCNFIIFFESHNFSAIDLHRIFTTDP